MPTQTLTAEISKLAEKVKKAQMPADLDEKAQEFLERLTRMAASSGFSSEFENVAHYIDWITSLPWQNKSQDVLNITNAEQVLNKNHYGLKPVKDKILE